MKTLGIFFLMLISGSAWSAFNDFECEFSTMEGRFVELAVQRPVGSSRYQNVTLDIKLDGETSLKRFYVSRSHHPGLMSFRYWGQDFDLEIDTWPDQMPKWGRTYRAQLRTWSLDEQRNYYPINCKYMRI